MGVPARPHWQPQGPATRCRIDGHYMGWLNCTPTSFAMAMEKSSLGRVRMSGCAVRDATNDVSGGTTLSQCASVARAHNISVAVYDYDNLASPRQIAAWLRQGRGVVVQGNTSALVGTTYASTGGAVNHAAYWNEVRGGTYYEPAEVWAYDPAADGRHGGWGTADQGPTWWPWSRAKLFLAHLRPASRDGGATGTRLGAGKAYCAVFADTEPHVHLHYGGSRTKPFPDRTRANGKGNMRSAPRLADGYVVRALKDNELFTAYQVTTTGETYNGSRKWYGNHDGDRWVHESRLTHEGGDT